MKEDEGRGTAMAAVAAAVYVSSANVPMHNASRKN